MQQIVGIIVMYRRTRNWNSSDRTTYFGPKKEPQISTTKKQNEEKPKQEAVKASEGSLTAANA